MASAQAIAAQEFSHIVAAHRQQIFRFLLASSRDIDQRDYSASLPVRFNWSTSAGTSWAMRRRFVSR